MQIGPIPVVEETALVTTRKVVTGRVRIETRTEEITQSLATDLLSSEVEVIRVPVGRTVEAVPDVSENGDLTIIPVVEERLVVTRELYLREEIHIRRVERRETIDVPVTTRRQTARIERLSPDGDLLEPDQSPSKDDDDDL
ncbi:DUF2382 domain-containing protein [Paracoccus subflavus]|uniref:DUF2382 domain-containing protein n=2 Tax=Paracoccus subflavus TaxID=2528244 RepID=A0A4Q9G500_9RHOB|nr:DUF2382 domain-containing protein [Paracoccus subflavus]